MDRDQKAGNALNGSNRVRIVYTSLCREVKGDGGIWMKTCLLSLTMLLLASTSQANLIVNGNFDTFSIVLSHDVDFGGWIRYFSPPANTDIAGWTISGTPSDGAPNNVDLVHTFTYPSFTGSLGSQSLDMEGAIGASGLIFQSFATTPGAVYHLSFEYANNPMPGPLSSGSMNVLVTGSSTLLNRDVTHTGSTGLNMNYQLFSQDFTADSTLTTLKFEALTKSGFGIALDAVSVNPATTAVPEPALMGPLGAGLVALLFAARCRGRRPQQG
jgi:hypothetical protein